MSKYDGESRAKQKAQDKEEISEGLNEFNKTRNSRKDTIIGFEAETFFKKVTKLILSKKGIRGTI